MKTLLYLSNIVALVLVKPFSKTKSNPAAKLIWRQFRPTCDVVFMRYRLPVLILFLIAPLAIVAFQASHYGPPAGNRPAIRRVFGPGILPGGRVIAQTGKTFITGPGPFGLAISPAGRFATANLGPERMSVTMVEEDKHAAFTTHNFVTARLASKDENEWRSAFMGISFDTEKFLWIAEGNSGKIRQIEASTGERHRVIDLNQPGNHDTFTGDLAFDAYRGVLYVTDQANFRVVAVDTRKGRILSSIPVGRLPFAITLSEDAKFAYVTNVGVFQYQRIPGAEKATVATTGLPFPAFGFPSSEARDGVTRERPAGSVQVPGLGDPNTPESNSVCFLDVSDPTSMKVTGFVRTGRPFSAETAGGSSPSGILAAAGRLFVSNAHDDTVTVLDPATRQPIAEIPLLIPGLEKLRGVLPLGMAYDADTARLLVTEAGINAIAAIDTKTFEVIGHAPAGWFPTRVAVQRGNIYVANAKGVGTGPNLPGREAFQDGSGFVDVLRRGTINLFPMLSADEWKKATATVLAAAGFTPKPGAAGPIPGALRYVVVIVKENRTFDEVFGDIAGSRALARFGTNGFADGARTRLSVHGVNVTPNHHALAERWSIGDNFYADSEVSVDGHHWLAGNYPDAWTESSLMAHYAGQKDFRLTAAPGRLAFADSNSSVHPEETQEAGTLWHHLERYKIPFRNFGEGFELAGNEEEPGEKPSGARFLINVPMPDPLYRNTSRDYPGFNMNIPDQFRATQFIAEMDRLYIKPNVEIPRLLFLHLPNDHMAKPRPEDGFPYGASYVADNDFALGRIVEYLSHTKYWNNMAIFVTEDDAQGGRDHIDSHRTVLMAIGPYCKRGFVTHTNSSFPGILKTVFRILGVPPLNLFDAAAADLSDVFTNTPDPGSYAVQPTDPRIFKPAEAREPLDPRPSIRMDAPPI